MKQYPKPYTLNPIPLTYFNFQQVCSILPLIAARLLLLAVQWKWSLAKSNNFQVILRIFPKLDNFQVDSTGLSFPPVCDTSCQEYVVARHFHVNVSRVFPTSNRFLLNEELIVHQSLINRSRGLCLTDWLQKQMLSTFVNFCLFFRCDGSVVSLSDWLPRALSINVQFFKSNTFPSSNWA